MAFPNHQPPLAVLSSALVTFLPALSTSHTNAILGTTVFNAKQEANRCLLAPVWYCQLLVRISNGLCLEGTAVFVP